MSRIRSFVTQHARIFIAAVIVLAALSIYVASLPKSGASGGYVCAYYQDATYKKVVGARGSGCCGEPISWGVTTAYKRCQVLICTQQICPQ
jgi:hypothetical protein